MWKYDSSNRKWIIEEENNIKLVIGEKRYYGNNIKGRKRLELYGEDNMDLVIGKYRINID